MLLVKNAILADDGRCADILINSAGTFEEIAPGIDEKRVAGGEIIDASGCLVTPTFVDPHLHLDKVYTSLDGREGREETLEESIKIMHDRKRRYTIEDVARRATRAIRESVMYGCTKIRANVDIDNMVGLVGLEGVLAAREACKGICDIQIVAFPQEGIFCNPGTEEFLWKAMERGADVVGGMPAAEWTEEYSRRHVDLVFEIAKKYGADIDMHIDQTKDMFARSPEYTAVKTIESGFCGRVTGGHCTSIAYQNHAHASKVMELLKLADFNVCVNPQVLAIMGIDAEPRTRGVTRVREMVDRGINVTCAQDTICDGFHLYGTGDPLDYGLLCAYVAQYNTPASIRIVYDMITVNAARAMGIKNYGLRPGCPADLNIIEAPNIQEAFRLRPARKYVIKNGKIIARSEECRTLM